VLLKLLHNSNLLQISISGMSVVEASLTLSFLHQTQYFSYGEFETIVQCFVCNPISVLDLAETVPLGRNCTPNIDARSFS